MDIRSNNHVMRRRVAALGAAAILIPTFAACSAEVAPPQQNIVQHRAEKKDSATQIPPRTSPNRFDFRDENGNAKLRERKALPAGSGTRNRLDFGEELGR